MSRIRLDQMLVARALVASRSRARDVIRRGLVRVDGKPASKVAMMVAESSLIELPEEDARYVSRGAVKLLAALDEFGFEVKGRVCLDVGASTGGFTQVLLARGAAKVYAVDVGRDQLHETLRKDARVVSLEGVDARQLDSRIIPQPIELIVCDVSFISMTKALQVPLGLCAKGACLAALIKPQFEVGRGGIGKGGIVRDEELRVQVVTTVRHWLEAQAGWQVKDVIVSPISGGAGNQEFLIGAVNERT